VSLLDFPFCLLRRTKGNRLIVSPAQEAYEAFIQAVETTNKDIASFQATILALHAEGIFTKAFTSRKENPLGLKQWRPTEHPDWADADRKRKRTS
jgi:hypothetical protein